MWFRIIIFWGAFNTNLTTAYHWYAENEGDLPDNDWVFAAFNGMHPNPKASAIRDICYRSLSVGDAFHIAMCDHNTPRSEIGITCDTPYPTLTDNITMVEIEGFILIELEDYKLIYPHIPIPHYH